MTTYPLTPQSTATDAEWDFLVLVEAHARSLAKASLVRAGKVEWHTIAPVFKHLPLEGLRPAWLNNQMNLTAIHARMEYGKVSQYTTLIEEYENALYGFALGVLEAQDRHATKTN